MVEALGDWVAEMEVHRQRCQACRALEHNLVLRRTEGEKPTVFVRCARCHALVAVYRLRDYYLHGRGFSSWVGTRRHTESARETRELYERAVDEAVLGYEEVLAALRAQGKPFVESSEDE